MNRRSLFFDVFRVEVPTGETTLHFEEDDPTGEVLFDRDGAPAFHTALAPRRHRRVLLNRACHRAAAPLDRMEVLAARFVADRPHVEVVGPDFAEIGRALEKLSDGVLGTLSSDEAGRRWIPTFVHDRDPGVTWFYDHATGEARLLFPLPPPQPHGPGPR